MNVKVRWIVITLFTWITRSALRDAVRCACASSIPRSGTAGAAVNCFITKVERGEDPPPVVLSLEGNELLCTAWDGNQYGRELRIPISRTRLSQFSIVHFYGLAEVRYSGLIDFLLGRLTRWPYLKIHVARFVSRINQYYFNKQKLVTHRRMELLALLVNRHLDGRGKFCTIDLMTELYSLRWVEHPDRGAAKHQLKSYLEAMVETGELRSVDGFYYSVTGAALRTIEENEEQERKHGESVRLQRNMFWLTVAIAAFTAIQAGVIKLPTLLDLSR